MRYHNITHDDMNNGDGLRVVLWVAGCSHHCEGCQNPITWNPDDGIIFSVEDKMEIFNELKKPYISGITLSGGDPMYKSNRQEILDLILDIKSIFPTKTVWLYTGYTWEQILDNDELTEIAKNVDVLVDGRFRKELLDKNAHWVGSTNQRVIDVNKTFEERDVVLHDCN